MRDTPRLLAVIGILAVTISATDLSAHPDTFESRPPADAGRIEGIVVDTATDEPLGGVLVTIVEEGRVEWTHADGRFEFPSVPAGTYTLTAERLGYARATVRVEVRNDEVTRVRLEMSVSVLELSGIVVTGTPTARLGDQALRPTGVLAGQELARKLDGTIAASIAREAGIAAASMGPATARPVIRGLGGDRVLILEDGARVGDMSAASSDHAVAIEPLSARRIEVVRGPAALLYGSNALGGVVNIIRDDVPSSVVDGPHGSVSIQGQSVNRGWAAEGTVADAFGPFGVRAELTGRGTGDLRTPLGELENTGARTYNVSAGAAWVNENAHVGGSYRLYDSSYGIPPDPGGGHDHGVTIEAIRHAVRGEARLARVGGAFSDLHLNGGYTYYDHREFEDDGSLGTGYGLITASADALARHDALGPFDAGAMGVRVEWRDFAAGGAVETPATGTYSAAAFVFEELDLAPLRLHFGARFDASRVEPRETETAHDIGDVRTRTFASVSGSVGALYAMENGISVGASLARAFRTPDTNELFSQGPHLASYSFEVGNPDLGVETGIGADVFARINRTNWQGEIAAFRNWMRGYIYPRNTGETSRTGLPVYQYSGENAVLTGIEGQLEAHLGHGIVLGGTASYVRGELTSTGEPLPMIPPLNGVIEARLERSAYFLLVEASLAASQRRAGEFETPTDGHAVLNAGGGLHWVTAGRAHSLTLRVENLTDAVYRNHLSRIKDIMPEAGRGASLLYRVHF